MIPVEKVSASMSGRWCGARRDTMGAPGSTAAAQSGKIGRTKVPKWRLVMHPTPPIRRDRAVSGEVGAHLERLTRELRPGDRLPPERELAEALAVSRTSVREALHELEQRRLIA